MNYCGNKINASILIPFFKKFKNIINLELLELTVLENSDIESSISKILSSFESLKILKLPKILPEIKYKKPAQIDVKFTLCKINFGDNLTLLNIANLLFTDSVKHVTANDNIISFLAADSENCSKFSSPRTRIGDIFYQLTSNINLQRQFLNGLERLEVISTKISEGKIIIKLLQNAKYNIAVEKLEIKPSNLIIFQNNLSNLTLTNCNLNSIFMEEFCKKIVYVSTLQSLDLTKNQFTNNDLRNLCNCLKTNKTDLKILKIFNQKFTLEVLLEVTIAILTLSQLLVFNSAKEFRIREKIKYEKNFLNTKKFNLCSINLIKNRFKDIIERNTVYYI